jgi:riboflavin transporter FmnP
MGEGTFIVLVPHAPEGDQGLLCAIRLFIVCFQKSIGGIHMNKTTHSETLQNIFKVDLNTRNLVKIAMLAAVAFVLMLLSFPLAAIFPPFLKLDVSEVPALLGGFALGPVAGVLIVLVKNILILLIRGTDAQYVGELSNFIVGSCIVIPASIIYMRNKTKGNAVWGLVAGIIMMTIGACISNYYLVLPLYQHLFQLNLEQIIALSPLTIVKDMKTFILFAIAPYNLLKGIVVSIVTMLVYKKLSSLLHR